MSDFIRRMQSSTVMLHNVAGEGGAAPPAPDANAGGDPPDPAGGTTPPDAGTAGDGSTPEGGTSPETPLAGDGTPPAAATPPAPDRAQQRMNQLVAERWAERRRAEAAEQQGRLLQEQLNQARTAVQQPTVDADGNPVAVQPVRPVQPQPDLQRMAADIAAQNEFNRQVGDEVARGRGAHTDFDQVASNLQRFGELPRTFVEAALATGKGADVMYALGNDIAEADRILSLPPIQQAVALATLAQGIKAPEPAKKVTSAPDPVTPRVGGGNTKTSPSLEDPNIPVADFIAMREKQIAASKTAGGSRARR